MKVIIAEETQPCYNISVRNALFNNNDMRAREQADAALLTLPDTTLLRKGMPLFVPDTAVALSARPYIAARICRLGRHIDCRFAHRYYDQVSLAVNFCAEELLQTLKGRGLSEDISRGFDGSIGIGDWMPVGEYGASEMHLTIDGERKASIKTDGMKDCLDRRIAFLSRFFKICHGDVILVGSGSRGVEIDTGQTLEGFCDDMKCLEIRIK